MPQTQSLNLNDSHNSLEKPSLEGLNNDQQHSFLNISVTPLECSVVVHSSWSKAVFEPFVSRLSRHDQRNVSISDDGYCVFSVISAGMDAGERVMELTSPLGMAGIPIFFITTYYSDFILVPSKDRSAVVTVLLDCGFTLSGDTEQSFMVAHSRQAGVERPLSRTPPPTTLFELQDRTFEMLRKRRVIPYVIDGLHLMHCSGLERSHFENQPMVSRYTNGRSRLNGRGHQGDENNNEEVAARERQSRWLDGIDSKLYTALVSALVSGPRFLSVTLFQEDPPSLLLDTKLGGLFGSTLVGGTGEACMSENGENTLVPIFLNLAPLPLEATGIVSGVAGRLMHEMRGETEKSGAQRSVSAELSYLSTAKAGAVILNCEQSRRALEVLAPLLKKDS